MGRELFEFYDIHGTPTVMILTAEGQEVDRIVGFHLPPDDYMARVQEIEQGDNTLLQMVQQLEDDPGNLDLLTRIIRWYEDNSSMQSTQEYAEAILENADAAREFMVPVGEDGAEISAYEYASFASVYTSLGHLVHFVEEFPQSILIDNVFYRLGQYARRDEDSEAAVAQMNEYLGTRRFRHNVGLISAFIRYAMSANTELERACELAEYIRTEHPDRMNSRIRRTHAELALRAGQEDVAVQVYGSEYVMAEDVWADDHELNSYSWFWALQEANLESAKAAIDRAIEINPQDDNLWDTLSMVLWKMGNHAEAINAERHALELVGGSNDSYEERIRDIQGDMDGAEG